VVVSRRDGDRGFAAVEDACLVRLEPQALADKDARALAIAATEEHPLPPQIVDRIAERSGGNPQFLLDLVDAAAGLDGAELPESVESAATVRIDRLGPQDRTIVRRAAVLGVSFHRRLVKELMDDDAAVDDSVWRRLDEFFVVEGEEYVRFRSAVVRDAAYGGLPFRTRRLLHAKAAQKLEEDVGTEVEEFAGVLSLHYARAGDHERAWGFAMSAADRAASFYANIEAAELYQRALDAGKRSKVAFDELLRAAESRAQVLYKAGLYTDAARAFEDARRYCPDNPVARARLMLWRSQVEENIGRVPLALRWASMGRRELRAAEGPDADRQEAELTARYAAALQAAGRNRDAARWAERAVEEAENANAPKALGDAHNIVGNAFAMMGRPEASEHWIQARRSYEESGELRLCAGVLVNLGALAYWEGRWDDALALYEESRESYMRVGDPVTARLASINIAEILIGRGIFDEAEEILMDAQRVLRAAGEHYFLGLSLAYLGRVAAGTERFDEALELFERAKEEFGSLGAKGDVIEVNARIAECQLQMGDGWRALGTASEMLSEVAAEGDLSVLEALLYRIHGYALMEVGDLFGAEESLQRSLESARGRDADYDVALTLHALAQLATLRDEPADAFRTESTALFIELGIRSVPEAPISSLDA
jgi:tetratricopeptide (TPR) repeat protein